MTCHGTQHPGEDRNTFGEEVNKSILHAKQTYPYYSPPRLPSHPPFITTHLSPFSIHTLREKPIINRNSRSTHPLRSNKDMERSHSLPGVGTLTNNHSRKRRTFEREKAPRNSLRVAPGPSVIVKLKQSSDPPLRTSSPFLSKQKRKHDKTVSGHRNRRPETWRETRTKAVGSTGYRVVWWFVIDLIVCVKAVNKKTKESSERGGAWVGLGPARLSEWPTHTLRPTQRKIGGTAVPDPTGGAPY